MKYTDRSFILLPIARALAAGVALLGGGTAVAAPEVKFGDLELSANGRVQYDRLLDSDAPALQQDEDDGEFRRVRLGFGARYGKDWIFNSSVDLVDKPRLRDLSLEYRGLPVRIEIGRIQEPFGLAEHGSSKHTLFMERPSPTSLGPDYGLGGALNYRGERWGVTVGAFAADDSPNFGGDRNERSVTGRVTVNPVRGDVLMHLGAGYSQRKTDETNGIRFAGSEETILISGFAPRGVRDVAEDEYSLAGGEFAIQFGSVLAQAEYVSASSDGLAEGDGWYGELGWILTGEKRKYATRYGNFSGVDPKRPLSKGGFGALEAGFRYSETDLSDNGGEKGEVLGFALNWYPIERIRLAVNAQRVTLEAPGLPKEEADVIQARAQMFF